MTPDKATRDACLSLLNQHWPERASLPRPVQVMSLNRIQDVLEAEGLAAITPARIAGWKEIAEEHLLPFYEAAKATGELSETS